MVNRKFVRKALINGKNLKNSKRYGNGTSIFLNDSFIPEFGYFNYLIRRAYRDKKIFKYKVRNGVNSIQLEKDGDFIEIG